MALIKTNNVAQQAYTPNPEVVNQAIESTATAVQTDPGPDPVPATQAYTPEQLQALIAQAVAAQAAPVQEAVVVQEAVAVQEAAPVQETVVVSQAAPVQETQQVVVQNESRAVAVASSNPMEDLASKGFGGLEINWTSFPSISLKTEGKFADTDSAEYGTEFNCRLLGSVESYVYRANPVLDNKRDVRFSYDRIHSSNGDLIEDAIREWKATGKQVEERKYLEVRVEMVAPGEAHDGMFRTLRVSPTSIGRASGHIAVCAREGGGDPSQIVTKVKVGPKVTKVANPFYPWAFEISMN